MKQTYCNLNGIIPASCFLSRRADCGSDINKNKYLNFNKSNTGDQQNGYERRK